MSSPAETFNPAETYESYMVPALFAPWAAYLLQSAMPEAGQRVLDVACGTGIVARRAASRLGSGGRASGLDVSPNMLAVARAAAEREGLSIEWREGRAEALPFPDGSMDLVLCQFALMFFADRPAALAEMRRVVGDRGRVVLSVMQGLDRHPFYQALHRTIQRRLGASGVEEIFALGDSGQLRALLLEAGFRHVEIEQASMTSRFPSPEGFLAGEIDVDTAAIPSMQHLDAETRRAVAESLREEMEAPLKAVTENGHVVLTFHAHVASAKP